MSKLFRYCSAVLVLLCLAIPVSMMGQGAGFGSISGVVQDPSGAVIAGAKVVVSNESKGIRREIETNSAGGFNVPALVPASGYAITVTKSGFAGFESKAVTVNVGEAVTFTATMNVAGGAAVVEVMASAPTVDQTKVNISSVVGSDQILNLPINGRRVDAFVMLTPGVSNDGTFGLLSFRGNPGGNNFLTDGNDTTNSFYDENAGRTRTYNISQDAVQEFQVVSSNYAAEYGKASGGVVNTVTRSGTNSYHGSGYEFFRNKQLNAKDVTAGGINPQDTRHQAGISIGGPIKKDKLFFFFNGEITRRENPAVSSNNGNNLLNTDNTFKNISGKTYACDAAVATQDQCDKAKAYIYDRAKYQLVPRSTDVNLLFGKIDYHLNDKHSFSFSSNYLDFQSPNGIQTQLSLTGGNAIGNNATTTVKDRTGRASWTWLVSNHAVNEFRFGYFKDRQFDPASASLIPSIGKFGLTVNGVSNLGYATGYPRLNPSEQRFQFADTFSWSLGKHNVKFGVDYDRVEDYVDSLGNRFGSFTYASLTTFAQDFSGTTTGKHWQSFSQAFGNPIADVKMPELGAFVQDEWHITPKLNINVGVRYDYSWIPQPPTTNTQLIADFPALKLTGKIPNEGMKFAPRFGFNYAIFEKTTIRGGFGIFNNRYPTSGIENLFVSNGIYTQSNTLNSNDAVQFPLGPVFGQGLSTAPAAGKGTLNVLYADPKFRNPYSEQANIGFEREMWPNTIFSLSAVWSRTLHLPGSVDNNLKPLATGCTDKVGGGYNAAAAAATCYSYPILDAAGISTGKYFTTAIYNKDLAPKVNSGYGRVSALQSNNNSYYSGLIVNISRRYGKYVTGDIAYTWSHTIDYNVGGGGNVLFGSFNPSTLYNGDYAGEKGTSSTDRRHNLVINGVFTPKFSNGNNWAEKYFLNNWQMSVLQIVASPQAITPTVSTSNRPGQLLNSSLNGFGGSGRVPFLPINSLVIGNLYRTDARISKVLPFGERYKVALSFEAFNILNHVIVTGRNSQAYQTVACTAANTGCTVGSYGLVPTPTQYGLITATQSTPDGTTARRAQAAVRITF